MKRNVYIANDMPSYLQKALGLLEWESLGFIRGTALSVLISQKTGGLPQKRNDYDVLEIQTSVEDSIVEKLNLVDYKNMSALQIQEFEKLIKDAFKEYLHINL